MKVILTQRALVGKKIKGMYEAEAKERQRKYHGNQYDRKKSGHVEKIPQVQIHETDQQHPTPKQGPAPKSRDRAAKDANANPRYITELERIERESPEVYAEIEQGKKTIPQAKREVAQKKSQPRLFAKQIQPPLSSRSFSSIPSVRSNFRSRCVS